MDLENSLITTWKDTQVLGMLLARPHHVRDTQAGGTAWRMGALPAAQPGSPLSYTRYLGKDLPPLVSPSPITLRLLPRGQAAPATWDTIASPWGEGMHTAPMPAWHQCHLLFPQLSQAGDLIIEVYLEQKLPDCCVTLKVSPKERPCRRKRRGMQAPGAACPWDPSCHHPLQLPMCLAPGVPHNDSRGAHQPGAGDAQRGGQPGHLADL